MGEGSTDDLAAAAFEALRSEVAALGQKLEALPEAVAAAAPDYTLTSAAMAKRLKAIEAHPALALTPHEFSAQLKAAADAASRQSSQELNDAARQMQFAAADLMGLIGLPRDHTEQSVWLAISAAAGAVLSLALWLGLSGPIARALPTNWHVPEVMAAATLHMDTWSAGGDLMQSASPRDWANIVEMAAFERDNRAALQTCRQAAIKTRKAQSCRLTVRSQ